MFILRVKTHYVYLGSIFCKVTGVVVVSSAFRDPLRILPITIIKDYTSPRNEANLSRSKFVRMKTILLSFFL